MLHRETAMFRVLTMMLSMMVAVALLPEPSETVCTEGHDCANSEEMAAANSLLGVAAKHDLLEQFGEDEEVSEGKNCFCNYTFYTESEGCKGPSGTITTDNPSAPFGHYNGAVSGNASKAANPYSATVIFQNVHSIKINKALCWLFVARGKWHAQYLANTDDYCVHQIYGTMLGGDYGQKGKPHHNAVKGGNDLQIKGYTGQYGNLSNRTVPCTPDPDTTYTTTSPPCKWRSTKNCTVMPKGSKLPYTVPKDKLEIFREEEDCNFAIPKCKGTSGWCDCDGNGVVDRDEFYFECNCPSVEKASPQCIDDHNMKNYKIRDAIHCNYSEHDQSACLNVSCWHFCGRIDGPKRTITNTTTTTNRDKDGPGGILLHSAITCAYPCSDGR